MTNRELSHNPAHELSSVRVILMVGLASGLFLGFVGPFGTYESLYLGWRLAYWVSLILCGTLFFPVLYILCRTHLKPRRVSPFLYVPLVAILGSLPMMLVVMGVTAAMFSTDMQFRLDNYLRVCAIALPLVVLHHLFSEWRGMRGVPVETHAEPAPIAPVEQPAPVAASVPAAVAGPDKSEPRLIKRLPGRLGTDILCLQMEDHYVRVHTTLGQDMILMRLRDAIAELDGLEGLQVHRSWWVARHAIARSTRDGKSMTLTLTNGLDIPVARDRITEIRAVL
jgi:hypothetical protein